MHLGHLFHHAFAMHFKFGHGLLYIYFIYHYLFSFRSPLVSWIPRSKKNKGSLFILRFDLTLPVCLIMPLLCKSSPDGYVMVMVKNTYGFEASVHALPSNFLLN